MLESRPGIGPDAAVLQTARSPRDPAHVNLVRRGGIEPPSREWHSRTLPLSDHRVLSGADSGIRTHVSGVEARYPTTGPCPQSYRSGEGESNPCRELGTLELYR